MTAPNPTTRLTEREKEPLRLWLDHKSAKEIALELGISHHAVEKRLKMARTKLGVASSLDAARILAEDEGYGQTVAHAPDLHHGARNRQLRLFRPKVIGATVMSLIAATAAFVLLSHSGSPEMPLKPGDLLLVAPTTFADLDKDKSGFLEGEEAPPLIRLSGNPSVVPKGDGSTEFVSDEIQIDTGHLRESFYQQADTDGDKRVSPDEYAQWAKPAKRLAQTPAESRIAKVTRRTFDFIDANNSGFLERPETPLVGFAMLEEVTPTGDDVAKSLDAKLASSPSADELDEFYGQADTDGDGRITYAEYHQWSVPRLAEMGYDLATALNSGS